MSGYGTSLSASAVPGETFSNIFRIFDRDSGALLQVVGGRQNAYKWAKSFTKDNPNRVVKIKNGCMPVATVIMGEKYG